MNIAYLSTFYPYRGGISQFNGLLYRELEKSHNIQAYTFTRQYPDILFPGQTQYVTPTDNADNIPATRVLDTINPFTYLNAASKISKSIPNLLLMKFWMPFFAPSLGTVSGKLQKKGIKSIAILDNVIPHEKRPLDIQLIKYFLNRVDGFVAMSSVVEYDLLSLKPNANYILKPHPLYEQFGKSINHTEACQKLNLPSDKKIVLFFGFIRDYKGLDVLIDAFKNLPPDYHLVIAGETYGSFEKYTNQINNAGLHNRVSVFARYINDNEVPLFFSAAHVCVLPYKSATQSGIVQIAYNFNLPVLATNVGGLSEMITHNQTGLIINNASANAVSNSITQYFNNNCYQNFSNAIANKRSKYSWSGFANEIENLYNKL